MKLKKIVPYSIRKVIPMLGLAGASMFIGGCEKNEEIVPTRDVEITFTSVYWDDLFYDENGVRYPSKKAQEYVKDPSIRTIYIMPEGTWSTIPADGIIALRKVTLEKMLNYSPKFRGKGDFDFWPGEASKVPADSLWYVQNGWTINKRFTEQQKQH